MIKLVFLTLLLSTTSVFAEITGPESDRLLLESVDSQYVDVNSENQNTGKIIKTAVTDPNLLMCSKLLVAIYKSDSFVRGRRRAKGYDSENQKSLTRIYNANCL